MIRLLRWTRTRPAMPALFLLLVAPLAAWPLAAVNPVLGYSVDLPIGWHDAGGDDAYHVGFFSADSDAMLQVIALDPAGHADGVAVARAVLADLPTARDPDDPGRPPEPAPFQFQGRPAALTDLTFTTNELPVRGYLLTIVAAEHDYALLAFALTESYGAAPAQLLSALDSFALDEAGRIAPGPISQFFSPVVGTTPAGAGSAASGTSPRGGAPPGLPFLGAALPFALDPLEAEATLLLVDREAIVLSPYGALGAESFHAAWRRYFRMIYRDNFARLADLAAQINLQLQSMRAGRVDYPHELLAWLQGFDYVRTGGLSDFQPPLLCLATASGDCDSLALTYVILLHHLGFDAILMASDRYAHALAAVDVPGPGARFPFEGRQWLVAELTAEVPLGRIAAEMADPAGWIGVRLRLAAQPR